MRYDPYSFIGEFFGVLKVIDVQRKVSISGYTKSYLVCKCICGESTVVAISDLKKEKVKSCGKKCHICYVTFGVKDKTRKTNTNRVRNRFRDCWYDMKNRCDNPKHPEFSEYGGRGITYEKRWVIFENFYLEMFHDYDDTLTIDRIDVNGNYCRENCRWVSRTIQNHNRRNMGSSSSYKGVTWDKSKNKWQASICKDGKQQYLGRFVVEMEAAIAYDNASEKLYGDRPNKTVV